MISQDPNVCGGEPCVNHTRIPVWLLISAMKSTASDEELLTWYPGLTKKDLEEVREYYKAHKIETDALIRENTD